MFDFYSNAFLAVYDALTASIVETLKAPNRSTCVRDVSWHPYEPGMLVAATVSLVTPLRSSMDCRVRQFLPLSSGMATCGCGVTTRGRAVCMRHNGDFTIIFETHDHVCLNLEFSLHVSYMYFFLILLLYHHITYSHVYANNRTATCHHVQLFSVMDIFTLVT